MSNLTQNATIYNKYEHRTHTGSSVSDTQTQHKREVHFSVRIIQKLKSSQSDSSFTPGKTKIVLVPSNKTNYEDS